MDEQGMWTPCEEGGVRGEVPDPQLGPRSPPWLQSFPWRPAGHSVSHWPLTGSQVAPGEQEHIC